MNGGYGLGKKPIKHIGKIEEIGGKLHLIKNKTNTPVRLLTYSNDMEILLYDHLGDEVTLIGEYNPTIKMIHMYVEHIKEN